jgi:hypothetical protein
MEKQPMSFDRKSLIVLCILGICFLGYFMVIGPYLNRGEGDPRFFFYEVQPNETLNKSVIHLEDKDILNVRGLDVKFENGKIKGIIFRNSDTTPEIGFEEFRQKYGSRAGDPTSRRYLEYQGVYYYGWGAIP